MSDYKTIHGVGIRDYTTDPDNLIEGQVWFDKTAKALQFQAAGAGSWASGGTMNTERRASAGVGRVNNSAALSVGGRLTSASFTASPQFAASAVNESYNGTAWTEVADLNTARDQMASGGTVTSALVAGGNPSPVTGKTESWNGTSFSEVADLNTAREGSEGGISSNSSGLAFGGGPYPSGVAITEKWNGTSWTEVADLNTARTFLNGNGKADDALAYGGNDGSTFYNNTETWNDTSWAEVADLSFARGGGGTAGIDKTSALVFGGYNLSPGDVRTVKVELWNGSGWSEQADLSGPAHHQMSGSGTSASALAFTGEGPGNQGRTATEEWINPTLTVKTADTD